VFTYRTSRDKAQALATELSQRAICVDLAEPQAVRALIAQLVSEDNAPDVFIHCAAVHRALSLDQIGDDDWAHVHAVNIQSAFVACQALAPSMIQAKRGQIVMVGALDRTQSFAAPVHFAASQGALSALVMALAKELGPHGICVNMVALGLLDSGLSSGIHPKLIADYQKFSALRRFGTPSEAAKAILWLALANTYVSGKVLPVNGGV
jgi:3-oxoacyl-[acyl-carrier protein] reductase